jgi:hypothetical protein
VKFPALSRLAIFLAASLLLYAADLLPTRTQLFSDYPFDEWAAGPDQSSIKWDVRLPAPRLSVHQRLIQRIETVIPGGELAKRRGRGELIVLTRLEDASGRQWRTGNRMKLIAIEPTVKSQELTFTTTAFIRPGDYRLAIALVDSETMQHNFLRRSLHIAPLKSDPLPHSWDGLPAVELIQMAEGPDSWFLPSIRGRLKLPLRTPEPQPIVAGNLLPEPAPYLVSAGSAPARTSNAAYVVPSMEPRAAAAKLDLLVNITPSDRSAGSSGVLRRNMAAVIPALKILSGIGAKAHPAQAEVMDLTRRRIAFETADAASLDWMTLGKILGETNPGIIDAKVLAGQSSMRRYFTDEIARRAGESGPSRWLIVLSGSFVFGSQDETSIPRLAPDPNRHIVYFRFVPDFGPGGVSLTAGPSARIAPPRRVHGPPSGLGSLIPFGAGRGHGRGGPEDALFPDDFERILKSMGAQVFTVTTPEAFRKSLASLLDQISAD